MPQIEGIIKEQYTNQEIIEDIKSLQEAGIIKFEDTDALVAIAKAFYLRGLVHGHAEEAKVKKVRENFGYAD